MDKQMHKQKYKHFDDKHFEKLNEKFLVLLHTRTTCTHTHTHKLKHPAILISLPAFAFRAMPFSLYRMCMCVYIFIKMQQQRFRGNVNIISLPHDRNNSAITLTILKLISFQRVCVSISLLYSHSVASLRFFYTEIPSWYLLFFATSSTTQLLNMRLQCIFTSFFTSDERTIYLHKPNQYKIQLHRTRIHFWDM